MTSFWSMVNQIIREADVILIVLDARMIEETRNEEIEKKVIESKKPFLYVVTKCDLVDLEKLKNSKLKSFVYISSKKYYGVKILETEIYKLNIKKKVITVGVLGYPNVGKSSLINAMRGKKSAPTSALSGYTRGIQKVKVSKKIMMIDTPGVIPSGEKDFMKHAIIGTLDFTKTQQPDVVVMELIEKYPDLIESFYGVSKHEDSEETIEEIALKKNILIKGGKPDTVRMARMILTKWQQGKIKV